MTNAVIGHVHGPGNYNHTVTKTFGMDRAHPHLPGSKITFVILKVILVYIHCRNNYVIFFLLFEEKVREILNVKIFLAQTVLY